jgi:hypothetical protein
MRRESWGRRTGTVSFLSIFFPTQPLRLAVSGAGDFAKICGNLTDSVRHEFKNR